MKKVTILGSTGSIGVNALDVIEKNTDLFSVVALAAGRNIGLLLKQIEKFRPEIVSVANHKIARKLSDILPARLKKTKVVGDKEGLNEVASFNSADIVISAISGSAGLTPTLMAIEAGKNIALANKETMVMGGRIVSKKAREKSVKILPVDSEHSAIFQCLQGQKRKYLQKIILTASGGPFLDYSQEKLAKVKLADALKHPTWNMGKKITIDSSSMMNKGLEVIEAKWLFNIDINKIDVLIHPQSVVHSMVEFIDGSVIAQMGIPDMRTPIAYALTYPERINIKLENLDLSKIKHLEFRKPDLKRFPCLRLAYEAAICGGTMPVVLNAANEIAVEAFIRKKINFVDLPKIIDKVMNAHQSSDDSYLDEILQADAWARQKTINTIERIIP
jgi:1-deoxy-D-xylulose-5-phosphate reductoisomerase